MENALLYNMVRLPEITAGTAARKSIIRIPSETDVPLLTERFFCPLVLKDAFNGFRQPLLPRADLNRNTSHGTPFLHLPCFPPGFL